MKIVYYIPSLYVAGGLERVITAKANYLADMLGYDVTILTSEQQSRNICYPLSQRVSHHDLGVVIDSPKCRLLLLKIITYPFKYYIFKHRFSAFLNEIKPDITVSTLRREINFINTIKDGSIKIGELHITRYAYSSISRKIRRILKHLHQFLEHRFSEKLKLFEKIVLLSSEELEKWPELKNTVVIHNFQDLVCESTGLESKKVIAVGRYTYQKGFDLLAEAWSIVTEKYPDWSLHIYGEGDRSELEKRINELNLTKSFIANGKTDSIIEKYLESSIFVLSSRYEGFGMVITEAMSCGVPPVSFACPSGPRDIITHGVDGLLVENGNIEVLAQNICFLIENEDKRKEMGKNALESVKRFSKKIIMSQWKELFEGLMSDKS